MPPEVRITTDDSVMVFGGGFGDEAYLVGSIELEGPGVLVHLTDAHPWEPPGESMTLSVPPDVLRRLATEVGPHLPSGDGTREEER